MHIFSRGDFALILSLRRAELFFRSVPRENLTPAAQWLWDNARALYALARQPAPGLRRREFDRLRRVCQAFAMAQGGPLREAALCRALRQAAEDAPWTVRELRALPDMLRLQLLRRLRGLLPAVVKECKQWLRGAGRPSREDLAHTAGETGAAVAALLSLRELDGGRVTEKCSPAARMLCAAPVWKRMDRESRGLYLTGVSRLGRALGVSEEQVCETALALCEGRGGALGDPGFYLLEDSRELRRRLGKRPGPSPKARIGIYAGLLLLGAALSLGLGLFLLPVWGAIPFAFAGCGIAHRALERGAARLLPRRPLPRLRPGCLPEGTRALVAVPALLTSRKSALRLCRQLSILYLANPGAPADFLLLGDFADAAEADLPGDEEIWKAAAAGVDALRQTYGTRFIYLQRGRTADQDGRFAGRERKRGALGMLNDLLLDGESGEPVVYCTVPLASLARRYSHVITLDADTFLPAGAPEKLLGAMLHPLQRDRIALIQPRMQTLSMHVKTRAQQLLGGRGGADGYGAAAADLYQDAFGRGSFMGKGIYEPAAFRAATAGLPQGRVLSHDLIEGELAHAALATDIVCYDGHPGRVQGFLRRAHRWTRGDWQIAGYLGSREIDLLSKIKIHDNLRRSVTPFMRMAALAASAFYGAWLPFVIALLPLEAGLLILPALALNRLDAAFRALWRMGISHKKLLEWTTAAQAEESDLGALRGALPPMLCGILLLFAAARSGFGLGFALGMIWLAYPLVARWLDRPLAGPSPLSPGQRQFLQDAARDTFRWFEEQVTENTHFLPPDNEQLFPMKGAAMRTSPTNMGLYLLSLCAARELGFLDGQALLRRVAPTVDTLEKLPCHHGIPYNWYDLETLESLPPRVLSSVDAGNYLICLLAAAQALRGLRLPTDLPARLDALCEKMELQRLYDRRARLFWVSVQADTGMPSAGHYDLLASEAQLLSFAAILCGKAPESHWWRLGRPWAAGPLRLMSWSGTMFEYMMGALLLPGWPGTLLSAARTGCVKVQRKAGRTGFFGISESGWASFDPELNYRYRAFGARDLALDAAADGEVYAPYAAALALSAAPDAACRALMAMKRAGAYGKHGFYEAIDYSRGEKKIVGSHMAHHQGMVLCAVCNALREEALPKLLLQLPRAQAHLPLLNELPPRRAPRLPRPLRTRRDTLPEGPVRIRADAALPADALLMSGGGTSLLLSSRGHGHLFRGDISLTRFDPALDALSGPQLYLAEENRPPLRLTGGEYTWLEGAARCTAQSGDLRSEMTACVDPLTGAAVYRVRLRNLGRAARNTSVIFYLEPALERPQADRSHIAFSNLFISAAPDGEGGCLLRRRLREGGERFLRVRSYEGPCDMLDDRALFFGREGTLDAPQGLLADWRLTGSSEPCLALRAAVRLDPGHETTLCFAAGPRVPDAAGALNAESLAAARSRVNRRIWAVDARQMALCARLAGHLLYQQDSPSPARLRDLWALGISGEEPLLAVTLREEAHAAALAQIGRLFALLCQNGAEAQLLLLLPAEPGYVQPLRAFCEGLALPRTRILSGLEANQQAVILDHCALCLDAGQPLEDQLSNLPERPAIIAAAPGGALPDLPQLFSWNGYGGFTPDFGYAVCRTAPAPWCHILCNEGFGTVVCEQGILYSYAGNSRLLRLTAVCQDSVLVEPAEQYFLEENGKSWSLTRRPLMNADCRVSYEMGAAVFACALPGLEAKLTCFADASLPCGGRVLALRNTSGAMRYLTVSAHVRFALGEDGRGTHAQADNGLVTARGDMDGVAFLALQGSLARAHGAVGELQTTVVLRPGDHVTLCFWLGWCREAEEIPALLATLDPSREREARSMWQRRLDGLQFYLPDRLLSGWLGGFLPYQITAARLFARAGFWQSGGAWGFRDQLQDMLPLIITEPQRVRNHLLLCASRQYAEGDVQHWWHPGGAGVRTRISDDRLFLPYVTAQYIHATEDADILKEQIPFLSSPPLSEREQDRYETPGITAQTATLMEHCLRAIDSLRYGPHGIPLMEGGDWNDGMNAVGGESVWLGFFLILVLKDFAPLCRQNVQDDFDHRRIALHTALQSAWTGRWFLRAWYRDGRSLGGPDSPVPRIDLISQCFAAFAGMPRDQVGKALDAAWDALRRQETGITLLLSPPFSPEEKAGYIGAYNPGVRENGGQYTHALPWFMRALLMQGQTERAWQLLYECLPYAHSDSPEKARAYAVEPYVLAGDIHSGGRGGWTWYTGSAAWLYWVVLRDFLGFDKKGNGVRLNPKAPKNWEEVTLLYRHGRSRYQLTAARDAHYITLDGEKVTGAYVPLRDDGRAHEIRFPMQ